MELLRVTHCQATVLEFSMEHSSDRTTKYEKNSLTLIGAVALGTGVMIGAGIFGLSGQMAEMTEVLFPLAFLSAALGIIFYLIMDIAVHWGILR